MSRRTIPYTLTREWPIPAGWTKSDAAQDALHQFQKEIAGLVRVGFRITQPLHVSTDEPHRIGFTIGLRGPIGYGYHEGKKAA